MKIGIDVRPAVEEPAGIGKLVLNLTRQLGTQPTSNTYVLYSNKPTDFANGNPALRTVARSFGNSVPGRLLWHVYLVYRARFVDHLDMLISTASLESAALTNNFVILIIADLTNILFPEHHVGRSKLAGRLLLRRALRRARHIVAISEHTRNDILTYSRGTIPSSKVSVSYIGCEATFTKQHTNAEIEDLCTRYGLHRPYILHVGTIEPRKNLPRLISAFAAVAAAKNGIDLVLAGRRGWKWEETIDAVKWSEYRSRIKVLEYVPQADLPALYAGATVFVYPSLYEGFGIPPLEAMTIGVPVVTSSSSSLPEVVGNAAILVDPTSIDSLGKAMLQVLGDVPLQEHLRRAGLDRSKLFSWEAFAKSILQTLHES